MNENPLFPSQDLQTTILNTISDAVYLTDKSGAFTFISQNIDVIFGYSQQEVQAFENVFNLIPALDRTVLSATDEIKNIELELTVKDGSNKTVLVNIKPVSISQGSLLFTLRDITERKKAEQALLESESLLKKIAENYPNSYISIIEQDFSVGYSSGQEFAKQNLDPEQFIGLPLEQIFGEHTQYVKAFYEKSFQGEEQSFELFINGQYQYYRTVPFYAQDGSIPRILAVVENISERRQAEQALKEAHDTLEERVKDRTEKLQIIVNSMAGREVRMAGLKETIKTLRGQLLDLGVEPIANDPLLMPDDG